MHTSWGLSVNCVGVLRFRLSESKRLTFFSMDVPGQNKNRVVLLQNQQIHTTSSWFEATPMTSDQKESLYAIWLGENCAITAARTCACSMP